MQTKLFPRTAHKMNAYWRAANYLSVARLSLRQSVLKEPLKLSHVKPLWSDTGHDAGPELHLLHLNRVIKKYDLNMFYIAGPGHAARRLWATFTRSTWSEVYPNVTRTKPG